MNTPIIKTLTLILTLLPALALTVAAEPKVVNTPGITYDADQSYTSGGTGTAALSVTGSGVVYSGTRITATGTAATGNGRWGAHIANQGEAFLFSSTIIAADSGTAWQHFGLYMSGSAKLTGEQVVVDTLSGYSAYITDSSQVNVNGLTIIGHGTTEHGLQLATNSSFSGTDLRVSITGSGNVGRAVIVSTDASFHGVNVDIDVSGRSLRGITLGEGTATNSMVTGTNINITMLGTGDAVFVGPGGWIEVAGLTVSGTGENVRAVAVAGGTMTVNTGTFHMTQTGGTLRRAAVGVGEGGGLILNHVEVSTAGADYAGIQVLANGATESATRLTVNGGNIKSADGAGLLVAGDSTNGADITIADGAQISGTSALELTTANADTTVNITVSGNSTLAGEVNASGSSNTALTLDHSAITGNVTASGNSQLILTASNGATISGDITGNNSSALAVTVSDDSTLTGNITTSDNNKTTVNISAGGIITGDLSGSDNSALAVTVGDGGILTGGLSGDRLTVTVNTGGHVTINKDSDFGSLDNHGTLNVGDYQVSVGDLTNNGAINISVNNDTGAGGSLTITDTASGTGAIHLTTTGDGQADPNQVLPNVVKGEGTEHWTWDEVDWGLEKLIVTPNPDGTITVKEDGVSPAGAVLDSAIAVQQSMWFAQQNSLLKRMGELRYGARASLPAGGRDARAPYGLIENIWLRSYGQQLNVGSQVSGKAYEQLIYGVDIGTDHKFTLSADSDLFLGVYAGYGRSDLDYRTPGTDGEINSYYGGLYATWLHASGFYIDATVKAASVNNDLKAPYGNTQLTASYSDVNIGGSIEIGHKFTFTDDWFIEPQLQVNYLHILAENYTAGPMTISAQDLDALQLRIGSLFGRSIKLTNSGALQPYLKVGGVETISSGGTLRNGYQSTRANTDGARAELGGGIIWQLDADNQLHLDYEASFGDKYDKPWGLTAGYRHQF
ncbi:MAG: autotransporter outer membrane beta-barrel domain-containing protein [Verrucomicrobiales bacterium]|nr:autotransporter outer membrane beta-barrel domain-containing protein [Verrucomicrobiales bacterium]